MIITIPLVILMLITFVIVFLFIKTIDERLWLTLLVSVILTPVIYFYGVYPMINIFSNYHHEKYFSEKVWKDKPALRYELSSDMMSSQILMNQSKTEINSKLGDYEWLSWNDIKKNYNTNKWNYGLGMEPGAFNFEKECLEIIFENNKVVDLKLYKVEQQFDAEE